MLCYKLKHHNVTNTVVCERIEDIKILKKYIQDYTCVVNSVAGSNLVVSQHRKVYPDDVLNTITQSEYR